MMAGEQKAPWSKIKDNFFVENSDIEGARKLSEIYNTKISHFTVRHRRTKRGIKRESVFERYKIKDSFFIGKSDSEAARELSIICGKNIQSSSIRQQRIKRDIEQTKIKKQTKVKTKTATISPWDKIADSFFVGKTDTEAAEELSERFRRKIQSTQVRHARTKRDIKSSNARRSKIPWCEVEDSLFLNHTDPEIANILFEKYGEKLTRQGINFQRAKRGLKIIRPNWESLPLGKESDIVIAEKIGCDQATVGRHRNKMNIKPANIKPRYIYKTPLPKCCIEMLVAKRIGAGITTIELGKKTKDHIIHLCYFENRNKRQCKNDKIFWRYAKAVAHIKLPVLNDELIKRLDGHKRRIKNNG